MKVNISNKASEYIKTKGPDSSVTILMETIKPGWCSTNQLSVKVGRPSFEKGFDLYEVDGIDVYLQKGLYIPDDEVKITLNNFLFIKSLQVSGIR